MRIVEICTILMCALLILFGCAFSFVAEIPLLVRVFIGPIIILGGIALMAISIEMYKN